MGGMGMRPASIMMFERLYLAGLAIGLINFAVSYQTTATEVAADPALSSLGGMPFMLGALVVSTAISVLFGSLIARRASNAAKWILTVLTGIGAASLPFSLFTMGTVELVFTLVVFGMQVAAIWFLFQPDAKMWFTPGAHAMGPRIFD